MRYRLTLSLCPPSHAFKCGFHICIRFPAPAASVHVFALWQNASRAFYLKVFRSVEIIFLL